MTKDFTKIPSVSDAMRALQEQRNAEDQILLIIERFAKAEARRRSELHPTREERPQAWHAARSELLEVLEQFAADYRSGRARPVETLVAIKWLLARHFESPDGDPPAWHLIVEYRIDHVGPDPLPRASVRTSIWDSADLSIPLSDPKPVPASLRRFLQTDQNARMLTATEAADALDVSRGTIYNWIAAKKLLGWRQTAQGTMIPAEQIRGPNDVVPGLPELSTILPNPRLAWAFLSEPQSFEHGLKRPIELLHYGHVEPVLGAAAAYGQSPT